MSSNATSACGASSQFKSGRRTYARKSTRNGPPGRKEDSSDKENVKNSIVATPKTVKRNREVSQEMANEEFCKRMKEYEKLAKEKETAEKNLRTSIHEGLVETSKFQKLEGICHLTVKQKLLQYIDITNLPLG